MDVNWLLIPYMVHWIGVMYGYWTLNSIVSKPLRIMNRHRPTGPLAPVFNTYSTMRRFMGKQRHTLKIPTEKVNNLL